MNVGYQTGQHVHSHFANTYLVNNGVYKGEIKSEHSGLEVVMPLAQHKECGANMVIRGQVHRLSSMPILIYNSCEPHTERFNNESQEFSALVFPIERVAEVIGCVKVANELVFEGVESSPFVQRDLVQIVFQFLRSNDLDSISMEGVVQGFLTEILYRVPSSFSKRSLIGDRIELTMARHLARYILKNFTDIEFSLSRAEKALGVSKFHLIRTFWTCFGITPHKALLHLRLAEARRILLTSQHTVIEVALLAGFYDLSTFNKAFQRIVKMTPTAYRVRT